MAVIFAWNAAEFEKLPQDKYAAWREIVLTFTAGDVQVAYQAPRPALYGISEMFVINGDGTIVYRRAGPILAEDVERYIVPAIEKAVP